MKNTSDKFVIRVEKSQMNVIPDKFEAVEYSTDDSMLVVFHRYTGISDTFLRTTLHYHTYYELEFVYEGHGTHILSTSSCDMSRGYACLRTPNNLHTTLQDTENPLKLYNIKFTADFIPMDISTELMTESNSIWTQFSDSELEAILKKIRFLYNEIKNTEDKYSSVMIKSLFNEILITFMRRCYLVDTKNNHGNKSLETVVDYINNNFRRELSVHELADAVHLTPNYLGELFISEYKKSINQYICDLRLTLAVQMLINTSMSVNEIALECGFNTPTYFTKKFREKYEVPPIKYRLKRQEKKK